MELKTGIRFLNTDPDLLFLLSHGHLHAGVDAAEHQEEEDEDDQLGREDDGEQRDPSDLGQCYNF
jgi:hypothetical protein